MRIRTRIELLHCTYSVIQAHCYPRGYQLRYCGFSHFLYFSFILSFCLFIFSLSFFLFFALHCSLFSFFLPFLLTFIIFLYVHLFRLSVRSWWGNNRKWKRFNTCKIERGLNIPSCILLQKLKNILIKIFQFYRSHSFLSPFILVRFPYLLIFYPFLFFLLLSVSAF